MKAESHDLLNDELFNAPTIHWTVVEAEAVVEKVYGKQVHATLLSGERDQNFLVETRERERFLLKITHPAEDPAVTVFQTKVQERLLSADDALPVPSIFPAHSGESIHWHDGQDGVRQAIRLMTFMPGTPLNKLKRSKTQRLALGRALAHFDLALEGFATVLPNQDLLWNTARADRLRGLIEFIEDKDRHALALRQMDRFEGVVLPRLDGLRRQVIHNDLNAYNVMMDESRPHVVTAILDFGDIVEAPLVVDVAVASAYQLASTSNPLETAAQVVAGYHSVNPLTEDEIELIPELIAARLLTTVCITGWRAALHPENRDYILRNNPLSWDGLTRLESLSQADALGTIHGAIHSLEEF
ncbi:phosphotransferase [Paraburkholderia sp. BR10882]|uniref:phosphotransferase n=1 Tax=unclassified Paraburkholderia TaxID=2615204 RepID=UPI0034CDF1A2